MEIPNQQDRSFTGANMTPMIDVVFLLIIFFLVSSHLAKQESRLPVDLPIAATHGELDVEPVSLTITLNERGQILVGGTVKSVPQLEGILRTTRQSEGETASIRIRSDGAVSYKLVEPVLRAAARTGLLNLKLAVKDSESI